MESVDLNIILQKLKEKEEKDNAYAKKIKECETEIKAEEDNIKQLQALKVKLTGEYKKKCLENSKQEVNQEILLESKAIWADMLEKTSKELKEEETKLEVLQQSIYSNRLIFCNQVRDYIDKRDSLETTSGFLKDKFPSIHTATVIKSEVEDDEYTSLLESIKKLENELEEIKSQEAQIEESKQIKAHLQAEPSVGESFLRLQDSVREINDNLQSVGLEIKTVKADITQKDLLLLQRKKRNSADSKSLNVQSKNHPREQASTSSIQTMTNQSVEAPAPRPKVVKFSDDVEMKRIPSSTRSNSILEKRCFTARTPSPSLRRKLSEQINSKLEGEMQDFLFKEN